MRADNTKHLRQSADRRQKDAMDRAIAALERLQAENRPITFQAVAKEGEVSRSYLYSDAHVRDRVERARQSTPGAEPPVAPVETRASESSLLQRLELAHSRIRQLKADNEQLRRELAHAVGRLRSVE